MTLLYNDPSGINPGETGDVAASAGGLLDNNNSSGNFDIGGVLGTIRDRFGAWATSPEGRIMIAHIGAASGPSRRPGGLQRGIASGMLAVQQYEEQQKRYLQRKKLQDAQLAEYKRGTEKDEGKAAALARAVAAGYGATDFARQPDTTKPFDPRLAAPHLMEAGQVNAALNALKPKPAETYGQPTAGIGPDGRPVFQRFGNQGGQRPVENFQPPRKVGARPRLYPVFDKETEQTRYVTGGELAANGKRYGPVSGSGKQRRIVKGADGYQYYADKGERVLPGVDKPPPGQKLTAAQARSNQEIDVARKALADMNLDNAAVASASREFMDEYKVERNPNFNPRLAKLVRDATRRKIGADPDFEKLYRRYSGAPKGKQSPPQQTIGGKGLRADLKAKADRGTPFTEKEFRTLQEMSPDQFALLLKYFEEQERQRR